MANLHSNFRYSLFPFLVIFFVFALLHTPVIASEVTLTWDPNQENDLAGYRMYYGNSTGTYGPPTDLGLTTSHTVANLPEGQTYYFTLTAYDTSGNESLPSIEVPVFIASTTPRTLTVTKAGSGSGTVTGEGISCGNDCSHSFPLGTEITLTASNSNFTHWNGCTITSGTQCTVSMTTNHKVTASYSNGNNLLTENFNDGNFNGWQIIDEGNVQNPSAWNVVGGAFQQSSNIYDGDLTSTGLPKLGTFAWYSNGLNWRDYHVTTQMQSTDDDGLGVMVRYQDPNNYYRFSWDKQRTKRRLIKVINGHFTLLAEEDVPYISNHPYQIDLIVNESTIEVHIDGASLFGGPLADDSLSSGSVALYSWGNHNSVFDNVHVDSLTSTAQRTLTVSKAGSGSGTITGSGISCGSDCSQSYTHGTNLTLTASASNFTRWSGCTSTSGTQCTVAMTANRAVTATFTAPAPTQRTLTVSKTGSGSGTITGSGISCGSDCSQSYTHGTNLTLTASASNFNSWSGCTSTSGTQCTVAMTANRAVTATFTAPAPTQRTLTVSKTGSGSGTVTGSGISCGSDCSHSFTNGTNATLTASASNFNSWSGCTSTSGTQCTVAMTTNRAVTATFTAPAPTQRTLTVSKTGSGSGTITGWGIACGDDCTHSYPHGTHVTFTASGSDFTNWSGCTSTSGTQCTVAMRANRAITATFSSGVGVILHSVVSPNNRSVRVGELATAFAMLTNTGTTKAIGCSITPLTSVPNTGFLYAPVDSANNSLTGPANTTVDIPVGTSRKFNITFVPRVAFDPINVHFNFTCSNASATPIASGLNTLLLSATNAPVADILALTSAPEGKLTLPSRSATGAFLLASLNLGASDQITMSADTGDRTLPIGLLVCEFDITRGTCVAAPQPTTKRSINTGRISFYAVFAIGKGQPIPLNTATTRIFVRFRDSNNMVRGLTSVALEIP